MVGDLIKGDIDISVAALTMTTEREEGIRCNISQDNVSEEYILHKYMGESIMSLICFPVIDFVAPYFDQSGISILLRKKKRETNVFKFLSVLKPEVCLRKLKSILHTTLYFV